MISIKLNFQKCWFEISVYFNNLFKVKNLCCPSKCLPSSDLNSLCDSMIAKYENEGQSAAKYRYMCTSCGKVIISKKDMRRHVETHLDISHPCSVCQRTFKTRSSLALHYSLYHKKWYRVVDLLFWMRPDENDTFDKFKGIKHYMMVIMVIALFRIFF